MDRRTTRRAVLAAALGAGVAGGFLSPVNSYLRQFAPLSGGTWEAAQWTTPSEVSSPHGTAEVRYDDDGVPHVSAGDEEALYFAVGYTQAADRMFQLDLQRRLFSGRLSEVVGEATLDSDRFHQQLQFREAAEATVDHFRETADSNVQAAADAYVDGINAALETETLPLEFHLLDYEPEEWTLTDSLLTEKLVGWGLTGSFRTLRKARVREQFGDLTEELYPARYDLDTPIIRDHHDAGPFGAETGTVGSADSPADGETATGATGGPVGTPLVDWLSRFEPPEGIGSNSWLVGTEHTAGDGPIICNDPHLDLQAPPVWYEMHLDGPDHRVRGVTFPGVPFVIIGENDHGAWGFTNAGVDVIDFYTYETDGDTYEYRGDQREFDVETRTIEVAGGEDEELERRRSVHGPVIEESGYEVAVAWTGHAATETTTAVYELTHSEGMAEARDALAMFDVPTQNVVYADREGETLYQMAGRVPYRPPDHEPGIFDGSAGEGEWEGFEPFSRPSAWDDDGQREDTGQPGGFVPFEENPHVINPDYLATANQQIVPDEQLGYYLAESYGSPYRGERIYELLDERIESGEAIDLAFLREVGRDTVDRRAVSLVDPLVEAARTADEETFERAADLLDDWDYRMDADSEAALLFDVWMREYREALLGEPFEDAGLGEAYYPGDAPVEELDPDSRWFGPGGRERMMRRALGTALDRIEEGEVYGDHSHTGAITHPLGLDFLSYPAHPRSGSGDTVWNFDSRAPWGGSWEMQVDLDGDLLGLLPGGNSGRYFSEHYDDQIRRWADGEYRTLAREVPGGGPDIRFREGDG